MWVLLVDDDLATVTTLRDALDWQGFGFTDAVPAYNVAGAVREIEARGAAPALIVCDIEMPMGSGLDLLKWVRQKGIDCEFIFLTCHESFHYASEALEYRAGSYLVKPFSAEKMMDAVQKAMLSLRKREYLNEYSSYGEYWLRSRDELRASFWRGLLFSHFSNEEIVPELEKKNLELDADSPYTLILVRTPQFSDEELHSKSDAWDRPSYKYAVKRLACEAILEEFTLGDAVDYADSGFDYIALFSKKEPAGLEKGCKLFIRSGQENFPVFRGNPIVCIGKPAPLSAMCEKRLELERAMQNRLDGGVLFEGTLSKERDAHYQPLDTALIERYLEEGNRMGVLGMIRTALNRQGNAINRAELQLLHQDFLQLLYSYLQKHEIQAHRLYMDPVSKQLQETAELSSFDMVKWVSYVTDKALACVEETRQTGTIVFKAMAYIRSHFRENVSRDDVAAAVFVTSSYLSRIFHQETGAKITDFLTRCRIEEAKALLRSTKRSVSDISVESGFDNFSYFSTVFKRVTGKTPVQFRKEGP